MEKVAFSSDQSTTKELLDRVEDMLRSGKEEESITLCKQGLKSSKDLFLKNKFEQIMLCLL